MSEGQETVDDIIAEKRRQADEIERDCAEKMKRGEMVSDCYARELVADIRREADRLEAAYKREKAAIEADALAVGGIVEAARKRKRERGDCAAMREALVSLRDAVRDFRHQIVYTKYNDIMDEYTCREKGLPAVLALRDAIPKANLALAAPPRNCDLPEVAKGQPKLAEQAWRVFKRFHKDSHPDAYGLLRCIRWLLAPATEKEGAVK